LGKEVQTLVNETKHAGNYTLEWNSKNLSTGIYFYKIRVREFEQIRKMVLIK
jgi:hypothetical protein